MIKTLRKIALGTVAIAAVIALFATCPLVVTHQAQAQGQPAGLPKTSIDNLRAQLEQQVPVVVVRSQVEVVEVPHGK